jgi:hypothetical protein
VTATLENRRTVQQDSASDISDADSLILQPAGVDEPRRPWLHSPISTWLGSAAQISTAVAGAAYGFGWLVAARLYGRFGVSPEDAGISFGWVAIRAFLVALASLLLLLAARYLLRTAERYATIVWTASRGTVTAALLLVLVCFAATTDAIMISRGFGTSTVERLVLVGIPLCAVTTAVIVRRRSRRPTSTARGHVALWLRGLSGALVGFVVTILAVTPVRVADNLGETIEEGRTAQLFILPGIPVLQMERVRLLPATYSPTSGVENSPCLVRLGGDAGTSIYWDIDRRQVLRVSDQNVVAATPC